MCVTTLTQEKTENRRRRNAHGGRLGGLSGFNSKILRTNHAHRSGADKRQRFNHPPPAGLSGRTRGSKSDLDARSRNVCTNELSSSTRAATSEKCQHATSTDAETAWTKTGRLKADDQLNSLQSSRKGHRHQLAASSLENSLAFCVNSSRSWGLANCRSGRGDRRPRCPDRRQCC